MKDDPLGILRGTLDLLILNALSTGEKHGYAVTEWIDVVTEGSLLVEEGTLYPALHRLERRGLVSSEWGVSESNRRAKYYSLTGKGRRQLETRAEAWRRYSDAVAKVLAEAEGV